LSLDEVGEAYTYREALDLVEELRMELDSHLTVAEQGFGWVPNAAVATSLLLATYLNRNFEGEHDWVAPWRGAAKAETFTPDEVDEAVKTLTRRSAFRNS
jgi:hypothetical protein